MPLPPQPPTCKRPNKYSFVKSSGYGKHTRPGLSASPGEAANATITLSPNPRKLANLGGARASASGACATVGRNRQRDRRYEDNRRGSLAPTLETQRNPTVLKKQTHTEQKSLTSLQPRNVQRRTITNTTTRQAWNPAEASKKTRRMTFVQEPPEKTPYQSRDETFVVTSPRRNTKRFQACDVPTKTLRERRLEKRQATNVPLQDTTFIISNVEEDTTEDWELLSPVDSVPDLNCTFTKESPRFQALTYPGQNLPKIEEQLVEETSIYYPAREAQDLDQTHVSYCCSDSSQDEEQFYSVLCSPQKSFQRSPQGASGPAIVIQMDKDAGVNPFAKRDRLRRSPPKPRDRFCPLKEEKDEARDQVDCLHPTGRLRRRRIHQLSRESPFARCDDPPSQTAPDPPPSTVVTLPGRVKTVTVFNPPKRQRRWELSADNPFRC